MQQNTKKTNRPNYGSLLQQANQFISASLHNPYYCQASSSLTHIVTRIQGRAQKFEKGGSILSPSQQTG